MFGLILATVLAGAPAVAPTDIQLTSAAQACKVPAAWLSVGDDARVKLQPATAPSYQQVMCVMRELQARGVYRVDLALPADEARDPSLRPVLASAL